MKLQRFELDSKSKQLAEGCVAVNAPQDRLGGYSGEHALPSIAERGKNGRSGCGGADSEFHIVGNIA